MPSWLRKLVLRGLAPAPGDRWPSMDALLHELRRDPARTRRRVAIGGAAVVAIAAAALVYTLARTSPDPIAACDASAQMSAHWNAQALHEVVANRAGALAAEDFVAYSDFATRWAQMHHAACTADDTALGAAQRACLDRRLRGFDAAIDVRPLRIVDVQRPPLPDLARCGSVHPDDPVERPLVQMHPTWSELVRSPDGAHFAIRRSGQLIVQALDGSERSLRAISDHTQIAGWFGEWIVLFDEARVSRVRADTGELVVAASLPDSTLSVSSDGSHALTRDRAGAYQVVSLGDHAVTPLGTLGMHDPPSPIAWSGTQIAMAESFDVTVVDYATGRSSTVRPRLTPGIGDLDLMWLDEHRLAMTGRVDIEHRSGLWSVTVRGGIITGAPALLVAASPGTSYDMAEVADRPAIALRTVVDTELVRVHGGVVSDLSEQPTVPAIWSIDASGELVTAMSPGVSAVVSLRTGALTGAPSQCGQPQGCEASQ